MQLAVALLAALALTGSQVLPASSPTLPPYRLGPGDAISIQVLDHEEWGLQVEVRPDGRITYPASGEILVAGMTIEELTKTITDALGPKGHHLRDPHVVINVIKKRPLVAYVLGAVQRQGPIDLPVGFAAANEVLGMVGGYTEYADLRRVLIYRGDGRQEAVDLAAAIAGGKQGTTLYAGDVMMVPQAEKVTVGVLGGVGKAGQLILPPGQTEIDVLTLILQAGGIGPESDKQHALILRATGATENVSLDAALRDKTKAPVLRQGDVLWVLPKPEDRFYAILGAVSGVGQHPYREGMTLADALASAGQLTEHADAANVLLIHADGRREILDLRPALAGEKVGVLEKALLPADIVLVPMQQKEFVMLGAVNKPGIFPWREKLRLADAFAQAGGPTEKMAAMETVFLVRRTGAAKPIVMQLDARELITGHNEAANMALLPDDTVYVPTHEEKSWQDRLAFPLMLLGLATNLRYLTRY
jgi:polysaccharide export outer membrane protein